MDRRPTAMEAWELVENLSQRERAQFMRMLTEWQAERQAVRVRRIGHATAILAGRCCFRNCQCPLPTLRCARKQNPTL